MRTWELGLLLKDIQLLQQETGHLLEGCLSSRTDLRFIGQQPASKAVDTNKVSLTIAETAAILAPSNFRANLGMDMERAPATTAWGKSMQILTLVQAQLTPTCALAQHVHCYITTGCKGTNSVLVHPPLNMGSLKGVSAQQCCYCCSSSADDADADADDDDATTAAAFTRT